MTLTTSDFKQIRVIIKEELGEQLDEKLTNLKSDFYEKVDPILKEVTTAREERPLIENRIEKLESIHPDGKHIFAQ